MQIVLTCYWAIFWTFFFVTIQFKGKTTWLTNLLIEREYHFKQKIKKIIYFYKENCKSIEKLKADLAKEKGLEVVFSKKFPDGSFLEYCKLEQDATVIVIDDYFWDATTDGTTRSSMISLSTIWNHHNGAVTFLCMHSYDIFLKASKLNVILMNSSHLIFFKTAHDARAAKRLMGQYMLNLKGGQTLFDVYKQQVLKKQFSYIIVSLSPLNTKPSVWSQVLLAEESPMLCFNESSDSEDE